MNGAGAIDVLYGQAAGGLSNAGNQHITLADTGMEGTSETNDWFGSALAIGDLNGDGYDDLAVGVPGKDHNSEMDVGEVHILYGSPGGLSIGGNQAWYETEMHGQSEEGDECGSTLAAADFDGDGYDDLAVGIPREDVLDVTDAGAAIILWGGRDGPHPRVVDNFWHQDRANIGDLAEEFDLFGLRLAAGDINGDGYADVVIGVPYEDLGNPVVQDAGLVQVLFGSPGGIALPDESWSQASSNVSRALAANDRFGFALAVGDFDGDYFGDLAIGTPYEDWDDWLPDSGIVQVLYGSPDGATAPDQLWHQDSTGLAGEDGFYDGFGYALVAGDFNGDRWDDLAIGIPYEQADVDSTLIAEAGGVQVLYGTHTGLAVGGNELWFQGEGIQGAAEENDHFGYVLAAATPLRVRVYLPLALRGR